MERDELTGLIHRSALLHAVGDLLSAGAGGALLVVDVDRAMIVNNEHGHVVLDECLVHLARLIERVAEGCMVGRYGGDEYLVYAPDASVATHLAERIRAAVADDARLTDLRSSMSSSPWQPVLTVSIGVTLVRYGQSLGQLLDAVNEALHLAKSRGRNRLVQA